MAFADSLRGPDNSKLEGDRYSLNYDGVRKMHSMIRSRCEQRRTQRKAEGYIFETYGDDYGWGIGIFDSLYRAAAPGSQWNVGKRVSALSGTPLLADQGYLSYHTQVMSKDAAVTYMMTELKKKLAEDGFGGILLEKVPCYEVYDEYRRKGFLSNEISCNRVKTGSLLGYAIKFHVEW